MLIHRDSLSAVAVATNNDPRYALRGVLVEADGSMVATDGHRLIKVWGGRVPSDEEFPPVDGVERGGPALEPFVLPKEAALQLQKALRGKHLAPILDYAIIDTAATNANSHAVIGTSDIENTQVFRPQKAEGTFPRYENVMPSDDAVGVTVNVNPKYLRECLSALEKAGGGVRGDAVKLTIYPPDDNGSQKPIRIATTTDRRAEAIIMPMHVK